jgi:hypothetical protein
MDLYCEYIEAQYKWFQFLEKQRQETGQRLQAEGKIRNPRYWRQQDDEKVHDDDKEPKIEEDKEGTQRKKLAKKLQVLFHPDKNPNIEQATKLFQFIQKCIDENKYEILEMIDQLEDPFSVPIHLIDKVCYNHKMAAILSMPLSTLWITADEAIHYYLEQTNDRLRFLLVVQHQICPESLSAFKNPVTDLASAKFQYEVVQAEYKKYYAQPKN